MKKLLIASALALVFVSCKKDKDDEPETVTPTVANLTGTYKLDKLTMTSGGSAEVDATTTFLDDCNRDDNYRLNSNMTYDYIDAGTQCSPSDSYSDTWSLTNSTTIVIDGETSTIRKFTGSKLELTQTLGGGTLVSYFTKL